MQLLRVEALFDHGAQLLRALRAVRMRQQHDLLLRPFDRAGHIVDGRLQRRGKAARFADDVAQALLVDIRKRADADERAHHGRRARDAAHPLAEEQVLQHAHLVHAQAVLLQPVGRFVQRLPGSAQARRRDDEHTLRTAVAERVDAADVPLGILFHQLIGHEAGAVVCTAQARGHSDEQDIPALLQQRLEPVSNVLQADLRRGEQAALFILHRAEKLRGCHILPVKIRVMIAAVRIDERPGHIAVHAKALAQRRRQIRAGIRQDRKICHKCSPLSRHSL